MSFGVLHGPFTCDMVSEIDNCINSTLIGDASGATGNYGQENTDDHIFLD